MKSIETIKEEVANNYNFHSWDALFASCAMYDYGRLEKSINEVAKRYAQQYIDANKELVEILEFIFHKTNFQAHFPTTSIKVKNLLSKHTTHDKGKEETR